MLNRRILRTKAFKALYGCEIVENLPYTDVETGFDASCEAVRDLYLVMLGIISPLTAVAVEKADSARKKFNPTEEEKNPNMKFAENRLAPLFDNDPDFIKVFKKRKFEWEQYDIFLRKLLASVSGREYFRKYMNSGKSSLEEDCGLFVRIFEKEFIFNEDLEKILEDKSIYWGDDLAYALTWCCRSLESIAKGERWSMPELYQSEMKIGGRTEDDRKFVHGLLSAAVSGWERYSSMVAEAVENWEKDRIVLTDLCLIVLGLAEAEHFPTIPVKVTINEYVDIAKDYGTPKSSTFVNGLLDRMLSKMAADGLIRKIDISEPDRSDVRKK
ncbi:MAG: transcription antitermination protein NusB [Bacteroidales bacterium]|nr:transcription antitermination protein NusB [Bacteroidales bacterium]